jgi:hypothetical protein
MKIVDFIIDFDRINELSSTKDDNPTEGYTGTYHFAISRKIVKQYLDIFLGETQMSKQKHEEMLPHVVNTLIYNRVLIHAGTIREDRINQILEEETPF